MNQNISFMKMRLMEEFQEGNAFTKALAQTPKGGKFKIGGKVAQDTSNYDDSTVKEALCKECGGMMYEGKCDSCGYMEEEFPTPGDNMSLAPQDNMANSDVSTPDEQPDHEVFMADTSLQDIISSASQLLNKIGKQEKDLPAWIQDHITNAQNYIAQANIGYYDYDGDEDDYDIEKHDQVDPYKNGQINETSLVSLMSDVLNEKKKPSAGLNKAQKSAIVKKAKKGGDIGKKGKGFAAVEKAAEKGGAKNPQAVAASAMWKSAAKRAHK